MQFPSQTPLFLLFGDRLHGRHRPLPQSASRVITITHENGLHVRPCHALSQLVRRYRANVQLRRQDEPSVADAHDVCALMLLGLRRGESVVVTASGPQAEAALVAASRLLDTLTDVFPREVAR